MAGNEINPPDESVRWCTSLGKKKQEIRLVREKESVAELESLELIADDVGVGLPDKSTRAHRLKE